MDDVKKRFKEDGYVFLPGFLSQKEVNSIKENFNRVIDLVVPKMPETKVFYEEKGNPATLKQLIDLQVYDKFFNRILNNSKFRELAELLLEEEVVGKNLEYFNKPPLIGKPTPCHQDGYYFMLNPSVAVTMWMALEPADEENGCVRYVKGSHLKGMRPHGRSKTLGFSQTIEDFPSKDDLENEVVFAANSGDLLIHHSLTLHYAGGNSSATRSRKALGLVYFGISAKEDIVAKAVYQEKLQEERLSNN